MYPKLVQKCFCTTPIEVYAENGEINEDGESIKYEYEGYCNYQSSCRKILTDEQQLIQLKAKCYFDGDIIEDIDEIFGGYVYLFDSRVKYRIYRGTKARNPDGTINYTLLELM